MSDQEIRSAQEQIISSLGNDPDAGLSTSVVDASISDGLACRVTDGTNVTQIDMPIAFGGAATGPSPGFHARAAVASCAAIGIKSAAALLGLVDRVYHWHQVPLHPRRHFCGFLSVVPSSHRNSVYAIF